MGRESPKEEPGVLAFRTREGTATEGLFIDALLSAAGVLQTTWLGYPLEHRSMRLRFAGHAIRTIKRLRRIREGKT